MVPAGSTVLSSAPFHRMILWPVLASGRRFVLVALNRGRISMVLSYHSWLKVNVAMMSFVDSPLNGGMMYMCSPRGLEPSRSAGLPVVLRRQFSSEPSGYPLGSKKFLPSLGPR